MLDVREAISRILAVVSSSLPVELPLDEARTWHLVSDVLTPHDSPPFDKSLMDGFAVDTGGVAKAAETALPLPAAVSLSVTETVTAGRIANSGVTVGSAIRVMTGAVLPEGADCVVPIELVQFDEQSPSTVTIPVAAIRREACIIRKGMAARAGEILLKAGTRLQAQHIAALAEFGIANIAVHRRPTIAILATGDELLEIDQPLSPGRIRNSNGPMLAALVRQADAETVSLGVARDNAGELREKIRHGLAQDFLLLSGGVSVGILDLVPAELKAAGVEQIFHGVNMKPGKPLWFGVLRRSERPCYVFGLPGNPVSSLACFELFVKAAIRKFSGDPHPEPRPVKARLTNATTVKGDRPTYHPANTVQQSERLETSLIPWSGSSDLRATTEANSMALLLPETGRYSAGDRVDVFFW